MIRIRFFGPRELNQKVFFGRTVLKVFLKVESTTFLGRVRVEAALSRTRASHWSLHYSDSRLICWRTCSCLCPNVGPACPRCVVEVGLHLSVWLFHEGPTPRSTLWSHLPIIGQVAAFISGITVAGHLQKVSWTFTGSPCRCGFPQQWKVETYEDWGAACQCYDQHDGFLFQVCGSTPVAGSGAVYLTFFPSMSPSCSQRRILSTRILSSWKFFCWLGGFTYTLFSCRCVPP